MSGYNQLILSVYEAFISCFQLFKEKMARETDKDKQNMQQKTLKKVEEALGVTEGAQGGAAAVEVSGVCTGVCV